MTEDDQVIRPELRFRDIHERGKGYPAARLKAIKQAMQKLHALETMAVNIYMYEITSKRNALNIQLVAAMANEMTHLQDFQTGVVTKPSAGPWPPARRTTTRPLGAICSIPPQTTPMAR